MNMRADNYPIHSIFSPSCACALWLSLCAFLLSTSAAPRAQAQSATIDFGTTYQTIDGFGGATAWQGVISGTMASKIWGNNVGELGLTLERAGIWNTDDSTYQGYRNDEITNIATAHSFGAKVLGTEWKYPAAVLTTPATSSDCWTLNTNQSANYASFLNQSAQAMDLDYVSITNEPNDACPHFRWTGSQIDSFVSGYASSIGARIVIAEESSFDDSYTDPTLNDPNAVGQVTIIAGHFYGGGNTIHQNALNHGKHVWMTEHYIAGTDIATALSVAQEINTAMNNQFSAYFWWWMTSAGTTDSSERLFDTNGNVQLNGYALAQFSKFIRPGAVRVSSTFAPQPSVTVTAYKGSTLVIVAVNAGTSSVSQTFNLKNATLPSSFNITQTDASHQLDVLSAVDVSNGSFTTILPAQSITTFHVAAP